MRTSKISPIVYPGLDVKPSDVDLANFLASVATHHSVTVQRILSPSREQLLVEIRQCVWYILYEREKKNYSRIGRQFGRDHATVLYGVKKIHNLIGIGDRQITDLMNTILFIYKNVKHYEQTKND
jgi:chromosomal replication initiator protein